MASLTLQEVRFTDKVIGRGSYGEVFEVEWCSTICAAKGMHDIFLSTLSKVEMDKLAGDFEKELKVWSALRHPNIVQFLGVVSIPGKRVPIFVLEKMDTSLRSYLEEQSKKEFLLLDKVSVLRQVAQGLCYLHKLNPPLVHHDLSPNNILLNRYSFLTKLTDFGMTRAINLAKLTRQSSAKGTHVFMAPEALRDPPKYNEKLDIFSFGNCITTTLTHVWPNPSHPTTYKGTQLVALTELERRQRQIERLNEVERQWFLKLINNCLADLPESRPSSTDVVTELRQIESVLQKSDDTMIVNKIHKEASQLRTIKNLYNQMKVVFGDEMSGLGVSSSGIEDKELDDESKFDLSSQIIRPLSQAPTAARIKDRCTYRQCGKQADPSSNNYLCTEHFVQAVSDQLPDSDKRLLAQAQEGMEREPSRYGDSIRHKDPPTSSYRNQPIGKDPFSRGRQGYNTEPTGGPGQDDDSGFDLPAPIITQPPGPNPVPRPRRTDPSASRGADLGNQMTKLNIKGNRPQLKKIKYKDYSVQPPNPVTIKDDPIECQTPNCDYFGYPSIAGYCIKCYDKRRQNVPGGGRCAQCQQDDGVPQFGGLCYSCHSKNMKLDANQEPRATNVVKRCTYQGCTQVVDPGCPKLCSNHFFRALSNDLPGFDMRRLTQDSTSGGASGSRHLPPSNQEDSIDKLCKTPGCAYQGVKECNFYCQECHQGAMLRKAVIPEKRCKTPNCGREKAEQRMGYCEVCYQERYFNQEGNDY